MNIDPRQLQKAAMVWLGSLVVFLFPRMHVNPAIVQVIHRPVFLIVVPVLLAP